MTIKRLVLYIPLISLLLSGCASHSEYDLTNGVDKEMTLFTDEVVIPFGGVGPVTVKDLLQSKIGDLVTTMLKEGSDGTFGIESEGDMYSIDAFEVAWRNVEKKDAPFVMEVGTKTSSVSGMGTILGMFGLSFVHQQLMFQAQNPFNEAIKINTVANATGGGLQASGFYNHSIPLKDFLLERSGNTTIALFEIPDTFTQAISNLSLENLAIDIPADPGTKVAVTSRPNIAFTYKYKADLALGTSLSIPFQVPDIKMSVELKQYRLHKCQIVFELENTIPLSVKIDSIKLLTPSGDSVVEADVDVSAGFTIAGGSPASPAVTPITLTIDAKDGTIPDLAGMRVNITLQATPEYGTVPLSSKQGVSVRNSYVRLNGGITLFGHEEI